MLTPALPPAPRNKSKEKNVNCFIHLKKIRCVLYGSSKPQEMSHISLQCEPTFGNNDSSHYSSLLVLLSQPHSPVFNIFLMELCSICNIATGAKLVLSILNGCTCAAAAPKASTRLLCIQASLAVCGSTAFFFAC